MAARARSGRVLIGPDNGVLSPAWDALGGVEEAVEITSPSIVLRPASATFHGRDVFAPAAAHVAIGEDVGRLGPSIDADTLMRIAIPEPDVAAGTLRARVLAVDAFGNVQLAAEASQLDRAGFETAPSLEVTGGGAIVRASRGATYTSVEEGALVVLVDSSGWVTVACNGGDAARVLDVAAGATVVISRREG